MSIDHISSAPINQPFPPSRSRWRAVIEEEGKSDEEHPDEDSGAARGGEGSLLPAEDPFVRLMRYRETSVLTTYWSETGWLGGPASRHGRLNSFFQVALHLPSCGTTP